MPLIVQCILNNSFATTQIHFKMHYIIIENVLQKDSNILWISYRISLNTKDLILLKYNQNCLVQYLSCIYYYDRLMNYDRKEETNNCQKCKVLYMNGAKANWTHEYEWKIMN